MSHEITIKEIGPVEHLSFRLSDYGVTVLSGPNGCGKSSVLSAIQHAAIGKGKLPLRDGARRGSVDACGAVISVAATTRYQGEFQVQNLESRLPLSELVDPKMKSPEACDKQRIKALVALTGVEANRSLFTSDPIFADFGSVVSDESTATTDLVEMAARVKRDYEAKARESEKEADREEGHARGLEEASESVDMDAESDADQLQAEYNEARDWLTTLETQIEQAAEFNTRREAATAELDKLISEYQGKDASEAAAVYSVMVGRVDAQQKLVAELRERLAAEQATLENLMNLSNEAQIQRQRAFEHEAAIRTLRETIDSMAMTTVDNSEYKAAQAKLQAATAAMELGVKIRDAQRKINQSLMHKELAASARGKAERLRAAAKAVDEVLSDAIKCDVLRVEIWEGNARLVTDHPIRGKGVEFHQLSMGEKWRVALALGIERVGEGGLLVVEQEAWEGLDSFVREEIHQFAVENRVYVLTAEATRDQKDGRDMSAKEFALEA